MLFLPQSVYDARTRLWRDFEGGKTTAAETYQKMLELDPDCYIGMLGLGRLRRDAGDLAGAEEYFWRAVQAQPCVSTPYVELSQILYKEPESVALAEALGELGLSKQAFDKEALEGLDFKKAGFDSKAIEGFSALPKATQINLIVLAMRAKRDVEPEEVTERLRALRLIQQMQEDGDLEPETVDAIISEGESIVPLLAGVLRGWAQDLPEADDGVVENALALLGETGSPAAIPWVFEFLDLENVNVAGAASWAFGRIVERHTEESARFLGSIAAGLGPGERLAVAEQIIRHPALDPAGSLLKSLSENLESMAKQDRDDFFPALLGAMAGARGRAGVALARAALLRAGGLLSRNARRECEDLLAAFAQEGVSPVPMAPSPVTVYEICGGNAIWDEDEDDEEDFAPVPEPVRRKATPGRNEPCWCGSGKKYKKCHLDEDERPQQEAPAGLRGADDFTGLRKRIGQFLGEALPERDSKLAIEELFGEQQQKAGDASVSLTDWILHDWIAPSLGRTVMQEFLVRRGSRLTEREREMVEAWTQSFVGLYEVQALKAGIGLELKDLIFGETFFVHDVSMSTRLARWDGLLTRVVPGERGTELAGVGVTVPRHNLEPLREWMEEDRLETGLSWREYLKGNWARIRRQSFEMAANWMESLRLSNTDGEELLISKAVYRAIDESSAIRALRRCAELSEDKPNEHFVWLNDKKTVLGNIRIKGSELVFEANSRQRLERGKLLLSGLAGESLQHLRDEFTTQKELKRKAMEEPRGAGPAEGEIPKEVRDEAIARFMERHYGGWPDERLPALDGKTPREAVRTAKGRAQVIDVLKSIENGEERKRRAGEPFYDVAKLRAELGLDY